MTHVSYEAIGKCLQSLTEIPPVRTSKNVVIGHSSVKNHVFGTCCIIPCVSLSWYKVLFIWPKSYYLVFSYLKHWTGFLSSVEPMTHLTLWVSEVRVRVSRKKDQSEVEHESDSSRLSSVDDVEWNVEVVSNFKYRFTQFELHLRSLGFGRCHCLVNSGDCGPVRICLSMLSFQQSASGHLGP